MNFKNILISCLSLLSAIFISYYTLKQIDLNRTDWEKTKDLNITTFLDCKGITYNIKDIINNNKKLCHSLQKLKKTLFFKIFKLNLEPECSIFHQENICRNIECQICECANNEVPRLWKQPQGINEDIITSIEDPFNKWVEKFNIDSKQWLLKEDIDSKEGSYIDLLKNPEGYTGYKGSHIWSAIFKENCFSEVDSDICVEDSIFTKIFLGWQVNTNFQIGCNFHDKETNDTYINVTYVTDKFLNHKERIDYLLFLYSLMLRAVNKAIPMLLEYNYYSGNKTEDEMTTKYFREVFRYELKNIDLIEGCFEKIYEHFEKFKNSEKLSELILRFRNISSIIDCVTCAKCRMHAKLEVFGIATMLKILFTRNSEELKKILSRNELVSFINLFAKLSKSVDNIDVVNKRIKEAHYNLKIRKIKYVFCIAISSFIVAYLLCRLINCNEKRKKEENLQKKKNE